MNFIYRNDWVVVESPVVALPSCPLVTPPSHLLAPPLIVPSLHHPLIISLRRLVVVASPLVTPPSRPLVVPHSRPLVVLSLVALLPSHRAVWLLRRLLSHCRLVLLSSSHCATLSSSYAGWLLCCLSLHCRHVLSLCHPLVAPPSCPLVDFSLRHPLVV